VSSRSHLVEAWLATVRRVGARGDVAGAGARLLARWAEPHRRYHDLVHLDTVLRHVDDLAMHASHPDAVRLAAWFHDAVYSARGDDEAASAELAATELAELRVPVGLVDEVARLVRLTATHDPEPGDADGEVLCDADLAILASPPAVYDAYAAAVREEYAHVPDDAFATGRARVLRALLARPALFRTPYAHQAWEARARANVGRELELQG
jgi:predicted metal-dependent HD superfamily phosphohydrolase